MANNHNQRASRPGRTQMKRSVNDHAIRTRRKKHKSIVPRAILVFGGFVAMVALAVLTFGQQDGVVQGQDVVTSASPVPTASPVAAVAPVSPTATPAPTQDPAILANMLQAQQMLDDPFMILVSTTSLMPEGYVVEEKLADSTTGKTLQTQAADAYLAMAADAANDGITLRLQSAYRSVSYQEGLFEKQIDKWIAKGYSEAEATVQAATVVNPPGASEHNCGLAADINCPDFWALEEGFEDTTAFAWLAEHAQDYGFILRYPKQDEAITGIIYEPWHWRYVGVQNAQIIKESDMCLESFLPELQQVADGTVTANGITATAAFQAAAGTTDM